MVRRRAPGRGLFTSHRAECVCQAQGGDTLPLSFFEPMVRRVFAKPKNSIYLKKKPADAAAAGA